eukprot:172632-Prymnesium_polylepis.1
MGPYFPYNPAAITDRFYDTWANPKDPKKAHPIYHPLIKAELARRGGTPASAKAAILALWEAEGVEAARLGTKLHLHCEYDLNSEPLPRDAEISDEIVQFEAFKASADYKRLGLRPYRTELCVAWRDTNGRSVSAGQIDALYVDGDDPATCNYYIFDFKRVKSKHKLCPKETGFCCRGEEPACALPPIAHLPDTHLQKYSLQASIYNLMLHQTHGKDAGTRMYLLRMHTDRKGKHPGKPEYELVPCLDLRPEAREVLRLEEERLAAQPPPAAPPAAAPPPAAANGTPPAQGVAVPLKRPRGAAPVGKVWLDGAWVPRPRAQKALTPLTGTILKVQPRGKLPRGMRWDPVGGCLVSAKGGCCKRKAAVGPPRDENAAPQRHKRVRGA